MLSVDIDHFKRINDLYGHGVGDEVLRRVSAALRQTCRDGDRVARMGGEEFLVLMPGTETTAARHLADRLVTAVRQLDFSDVATGLKVTISAGSASADELLEPLDLILRRLDMALYAAKHAGRDRVVQAEPAFAV